MDTQSSFETMLEKHKIIVERYINYRMPCSFDADDDYYTDELINRIEKNPLLL